LIYIKEIPNNDLLVTICADGVLDGESLPILKNVCLRHLEKKKRVLLRLEGLIHISREGRDFLHKIQREGAVFEPPNVLDWGAGNAKG
jgi:hypothetical protein